MPFAGVPTISACCIAQHAFCHSSVARHTEDCTTKAQAKVELYRCMFTSVLRMLGMLGSSASITGYSHDLEITGAKFSYEHSRSCTCNSHSSPTQNSYLQDLRLREHNLACASLDNVQFEHVDGRESTQYHAITALQESICSIKTKLCNVQLCSQPDNRISWQGLHTM